MLKRYRSIPIDAIWSDRFLYQTYIDIEQTVNDQLQAYKVIPQNILSQVLSKLDVDTVLQLSSEIEKTTGHDIVAFIFAIERLAQVKDARWIHFGLTSSDIKDTATAIQLKKSLALIISSLNELMKSLQEKACRHPVSILVRTHGMIANKTTIGNVFTGWSKYIQESKFELSRLSDNLHGKCSGIIGDNRHIDEPIEEKILDQLHLKRSQSPTQVIRRTEHSRIINELAVLASSIECIATQIRLFHQDGVNEINEGFLPEQAGSSAMPHKKNPILSENLCGLARVVKGYVQPGLDNIPLWGYRDMTHSSVERIVLPESLSLIHFMIWRLKGIINNLDIDTEIIKQHILEHPEVNSEKRLLDLIRSGLSREEAYRQIQGETKCR